MTFSESAITADTSKPLLDITVGDLLRRATQQTPDTVALIDGAGDIATRGRWTYVQLLEQAERSARALLGVLEPGEHVAIFAPNCPEWTFAQLGAALAGLVLVTVNPALRPSEARHVLGQSDSVGVIVADRHRGQDLVAMVDELRGDLPQLREVIRLADWDDFCTRGTSRDDRALPVLAPRDHVMIQYTSGTTGLPKGAILHHFGLVNAGQFIAERIDRRPGDIWLNPLPLFHTGGCVMGTLGAMASSGTLIVMREFDPALMLRLIEEERPVYALGVPTMIIALLEHPDFAARDTSSLRLFSSGATTVPPELVRRIESEFKVTYNMVMGQTESSSVIFMTRLDSTTYQKAQTLGVPLLHWETKIADENGTPVAIGEAGELCVRGWGVMAGYYNMPEATAAAIDAEDWLHTGDIATMDVDGFTAITGRLKDMIIRGGENIFPREIEDVLIMHPGVAEAAVIGVPDDRWGEQPIAYIRTAAGAGTPSEAELVAFVREHIAPHKRPRQWFFVDSFPMNGSGKVQKFLLREQHDAAVPPGPASGFESAVQAVAPASNLGAWIANLRSADPSAALQDRLDEIDRAALDNTVGFAAEHTRRYIATNGADDGWQGPRPILVLYTKGRRSGTIRRNPVLYIDVGARRLLVASKGGAATNPAWYENLVADPTVHVRVMTEVYVATATPLGAEDRASVWSEIVQRYPMFGEYQAITDRLIPVVELLPA